MKITKELKYATFEYDEKTKSFLIIDTEEGGVVELNKVYSFAFMRFVIRMAQRNWYKKTKNNSPNNEEHVPLADHPFEDPKQEQFELSDILDVALSED